MKMNHLTVQKDIDFINSPEIDRSIHLKSKPFQTKGNSPSTSPLPDVPFVSHDNILREILDADDSERLDVIKSILETLSQDSELLKQNQIFIQQFAYECPIQSISSAFQTLLVDKKLFTCSRFISNKNLEPATTRVESVSKLYTEYFLENGFISNIEKVLASFFPKFCETFMSSFGMIMKGNGPLTPNYRNIIAYYASSRYDCHYLMKIQQSEFILNDGDVSWFKMSEIPRKLKNLLDFNTLLAHQPWLITKESVDVLLKRDEYGWTVPELVHAIIIMSTFHSLSCLVLGLGILDENDTCEMCLFEGAKEQELNENIRVVSKLKMEEEEDPLDTEERVSLFERTESPTQTTSPPLESLHDKQYVDFDLHIHKIHNERDFNWKDHGYGLVSRFYPGAESVLDDEFEMIYNLTANNFSNVKNVDTSRFRHGIWFYTHRLYGIIYDDFKYNNINTLLNKDLKVYIKKTACFPEKITLNDFTNMGLSFEIGEKVHINLLTVESKKQLSIVYGLMAISKHLKSIKV
jgi:hypothetical protein